ncbi:MAG: hypothetical protein ABJX32_05160 [Tateyamaria sp.]|uniref:hypothetical protein n=1 Tax=Tateyamaria sp. TaxID=1929288 RepID=UPI0032A032D8
MTRCFRGIQEEISLYEKFLGVFWVMTRRTLAAAICLALMVGFMTTSQLLFKAAGLQLAAAPHLFFGLVTNQWFWLSLVTSTLGLVCWTVALKTFSLSKAYPWTAFIYAATPVLSVILFKETLSETYVYGMFLIVCGVFFTAGSNSSE